MKKNITMMRGKSAMTNKEKIVSWCADHGIDVMKYALEDSDYDRSGTIIIRSLFMMDMDHIEDWRRLIGSIGYPGCPVEMKKVRNPYSHRILGHVDRLIWKEGKK